MSLDQQQHYNQFQYAGTCFQSQGPDQAQAQDHDLQMTDAMPVGDPVSGFAPANTGPQLGQSSAMDYNMAATTITPTLVEDHQGIASQQFMASQLGDIAVHNRPDPSPSQLQSMFASLRMDPSPLSQDKHGRLHDILEEDAISLDFGMSPEEYLAMFPSHRSYRAYTDANSLSNHYSPSNAPSAPASMIWSQSAPDAPVPMTRENSYPGNQPAVNMERLASSSSHCFPGEDANSESTVRPSVDDSDFKYRQNFNLFAVGSIFDIETPYQDVSSTLTETFANPPNSAQREQFDSITSMLSMRSIASQWQTRKVARRVQENQKAVIAPKPQLDSGSIYTKDGLPNDGAKLAADQERNQQPKDSKVICNLCGNDFRGNHELRRHIDNKHHDLVKKYACVDPAVDLEAIRPLDRCKDCKSGKLYNRGCNAAAHLRRMHFREKTRRARGKAIAPTCKRQAGKGDKTWPPMTELKRWFKEVIVPSHQTHMDINVTGTVNEDGSDTASNINDASADNADNADNAEDSNENSHVSFSQELETAVSSFPPLGEDGDLENAPFSSPDNADLWGFNPSGQDDFNLETFFGL